MPRNDGTTGLLKQGIVLIVKLINRFGRSFLIWVYLESMMSFNTRLSDRAKKINSYLCVGIDISPELLGSDKLEDLVAHSKLVVDATRDIALAYKPNFAFFERWGPKGFEWLEQLIKYIGEEPILIADAKRGDIGTTASQYAESIFNYFGFLAPYLDLCCLLAVTPCVSKFPLKR